jgi:hypothetical protein
MATAVVVAMAAASAAAANSTHLSLSLLSRHLFLKSISPSLSIRSQPVPTFHTYDNDDPMSLNLFSL